MNKILRYTGRLFILLIPGFSAFQCSDDCTLKRTSWYTEPVYMSFSELRKPVVAQPARALQSTGKIYFKDGYIYLNEPDKGIHVIDNRDPSNPALRSFIPVPGNIDIAIRNNILYADSYVDLVAIDITTVGQEREVNRFEDMFASYGPNMNFGTHPTLGVITELKLTDRVVETSSCSNQIANHWSYYEYGIAVDAQMIPFSAKGTTISSNVIGGASIGKAGSMARFAIKDNFLYALDGPAMDVVNVSNATDLSSNSSIAVNWGIETIFPYDNSLFLGSKTGMYIYGLNDPSKPEYLSMFTHIRSCDPVVVEGDYAYVTLRDGNSCNGVVNQLQVVRIKDQKNPELVSVSSMTNPHGLGIDNDVLFICDGRDGLKIFDATMKGNIGAHMIKQYTEMKAFDVIPYDKVAMMIAEDGLYQYDYSNLQDIKFLSKLPIQSEE